MHLINTAFIAALAGALCCAAPGAARAADLAVQVNHIERAEGTIFVGIFDSPESFPKKILRGQTVPSAARSPAGSVTVIFHDLAPGQYAASAYQDVDGDGKLSSNLAGMPTEPYGFSRDAVGSFGPPAFGDAAFTVPAEGTQVSLTLR